ncbi:hypothetical protein PQR15_00040 [Streptomyces lydicus]|nr:hypothetical protein [Streptomyces lydicus]
MRELCQEMHHHLRDARLVELLDTAFQDLPEPVTPPQHCYQRLIRGGTERVRLADAASQGGRGHESQITRRASLS